MTVQNLSKKSPPIQDAPKSYTPYIKYTKLQFEVRKEIRTLILSSMDNT